MFLRATRSFIIFLSLFFLFSGAHGASIGYESFEKDNYHVESLNVPSRQVQPCRNWSFNHGGRGYVCNSYEFSINVPDAQRLNQTIAHLEDRIRQLEARIYKLDISDEKASSNTSCKN